MARKIARKLSFAAVAGSPPRKVAKKGARKGGKKARKAAAAKPHKVRAVGSKAAVFKGHAKHTSGGLTKKDILRLVIRRGGKKVGYRYVSKRKHAAGQKLQRKLKASGKSTRRFLRLWRLAIRRVTGGRIPRKGTSEYAKVKALYKGLLARGGSKETPKKVRMMVAAKTIRAKKAGKPKKAKKAGKGKKRVARKMVAARR
jgi:hypothetical protein